MALLISLGLGHPRCASDSHDPLVSLAQAPPVTVSHLSQFLRATHTPKWGAWALVAVVRQV
jgi:hypothetical protein